MELPSIVCLLAVMATGTYGSVVTFEKNPDIIHTILTKYMTLTCGVNDSMTSPSGSLVGRRSVTQGQEHLQFVTSMVVLRNGKEVATITPFSPATAMQDKGKLNVTGSVGGHGQIGNLTLQWYYPDEVQSGNYTCEVNGISPSGHSVTLSADVFVPVQNPDMQTIIQHVHDQEIRIEEQGIKNKDLQNQLKNIESNILAQVRNEMNQMKNEMSLINTQMNASRHFENGTELCGGGSPSRGNPWTTDGSYRKTEMTVKFKSPYSSPPIVHVSPLEFDHYHYHHSTGTASYTSFMLELINVTDSSFSLRCKTRRENNNYYYTNRLSVNWLSVP